MSRFIKKVSLKSVVGETLAKIITTINDEGLMACIIHGKTDTFPVSAFHSTFCIIRGFLCKTERKTHRNVNKNCIKNFFHFELSQFTETLNYPTSFPLLFCASSAVERQKKLVTAKCVYNFFETTFPPLKRQVPTSVSPALFANRKIQKEMLRRVSYCKALNKLDV